MIDIQKQTLKHANTLQGVIGDNLFPELQHVSDVKQVLELMMGLAQNISQEQLRAVIFLNQLGENKLIHPNGNPYEKLTKDIMTDYKTAVANPAFYLDTIEELIPKPPKPVVFAPSGKQVNTGRE
ncbi:hypothetical protein [Lysinibacillus sp. D3C2_S12]|uniref:hypothetical protein n=1 Tax=Lysinibacillus sp. D3C2_S12 TaxID=2941226 RepID=UPI0020C0466F|nr:hypothetical protein [Lysinibacillus sp. D3C2_S12]